jgi:hypothetical protein
VRRGATGDALAQRQATAAQELSSSDVRLDFTVWSLDLVGEALGRANDAELDKYAAYVGEVVRREVPGGRWTTELRHRRRQPVLRWEFSRRTRPGPEWPRFWVIDPRRLIDAVIAGEFSSGLRLDVEQALAYMRQPSEAAAQSLGLRSTTTRERRARVWNALRRRKPSA